MSLPPDKELVIPAALVKAWRTDRPAPAELRRTYARFVRSQRTQRGSLRVVYWVAMGTLLGAGLAQAATLGDWKAWLGHGAQHTVQPSHRPQQPELPPAPPPPRVATSAVARPAGVPEKTVGHGAPPAPPRPQLVPSESTPEQAVREQWQRAAAALREKDFAKAQQALLEIEASAPAGEHEAARLARAQLLSSHGRHSEAAGLLRDLAASGQSELVRSKARALLEGAAKVTAPDRSTRPGQDTQ